MTSSLQGYTADEMREISAAKDASTGGVDAALCADFWSMPETARGRMFDLLGASGCETRAWWEERLGVAR